jgi:lanosterol synthase
MSPPANDALTNGLRHLRSLQHPDGRWEGEVTWNSMPLSQYVLVRRVVGEWPLASAETTAITQQYQSWQAQNGSFAASRDGEASVLVSVLAYVALRVLDVDVTNQLVAATRRWLHSQRPHVEAMPSWGRVWLALFGIYDYDGLNLIPPELLLLPRKAPVRMSSLYCHTRHIYLAMAYLCGARVRFDLGQLGRDLRIELFGSGDPEFASFRHRLSGPDVLVRPHAALRASQRVANLYGRRPNKHLRKHALRRCAQVLDSEREASAGYGLSPVSALLACLVRAHHDGELAPARSDLDRLDYWRWHDGAGIRYAGARSSSWDTSFALRAQLASLDRPECAPDRTDIRRGMATAYAWLTEQQIQHDDRAPGCGNQDGIVGGWCFGDRQTRWPVSDCTAEATLAILALHERPDVMAEVSSRLPPARLESAIEFLLRRQNHSGGFSTYERQRLPLLIEKLNPAEMFTHCMADYAWVECTASCLLALNRFRLAYPDYEPVKLERAIRRGIGYLRSRQLPDGSYPAGWGINFSYAIYFAIEALSANGVSTSDPAIAGAARWLLEHQRPDGGWGEHHTSVKLGHYVEHPESQAVMTAWAILGLVRSVGPEHSSVLRGQAFLARLQSADGGWPRQAPSGMYFGGGVVDYDLYRDVFPLWALSEAPASLFETPAKC